METSLNVYDYPDPPETKEKTVKAKVYISFELEYDVPEKWDREQIENDIKENLDDFTWYNEEIEDVEIN